MKAFLSHSSEDKEFVQAVATELGRQSCIYDLRSFETGVQLKESIETGLDGSAVFVLFASTASMKSIWVNFEIEEAWFRTLVEHIKSALVFIIDSQIQIAQIPTWLSRAKIVSDIAPKAVARTIKAHLDKLQHDKLLPFFVGRSNSVEEVEKGFTPLGQIHGPRALFVCGLPGIGRRTLIRNTIPKLLNLPSSVEVRIGEGDSINDFCIKVADLAEPYSTSDGLISLVSEIQHLTPEAALARAFSNLRNLNRRGEAPILFDEGGLLSVEGNLTETAVSILSHLAPNDEAYLFFVTNRFPNDVAEFKIPVVRLTPLGDAETKRLIQVYSQHLNVQIPADELDSIASFVGGYPPAAYYAVQQIRDYGLGVVLSDRNRLARFTNEIFLVHLNKAKLSDNQRVALRLLATHSPLPLPIIATVTGTSLEIMGQEIGNLIDYSLVYPTKDGLYRIADPVAPAVISTFGIPTVVEHKQTAIALSEFLKSRHSEIPQLELVRVAFRAASLSNDPFVGEFRVFLANDLIQLAEKHYHARNYEMSISCARGALQMRPNSVSARAYLIRALANEEKYSEAEYELSSFQMYAPIYDIQFLRGFVARKRGNIHEAIRNYERAEQGGRRGMAIKRELGLCYFHADNLEMAWKYIGDALRVGPDNPYLLDIAAQIATKSKDQENADKMLARLAMVDRPSYYYHRKSRTEMQFGKLNEARASAEKAFQSMSNPPFQIIAQFAYCELELGGLNHAEKLIDDLDRRFANKKSDIRMGLRCRHAIKSHNYKQALQLHDRIKDKDSYFSKRLRLDALLGELASSALSDKVRDSYKNEVDNLGAQLAERPALDFDVLDFD